MNDELKRKVEACHVWNVDQDTVYLLAEALECIIFAVEKLSEQHRQELQADLERPIQFCKEALVAVRKKNDTSTSTLAGGKA